MYIHIGYSAINSTKSLVLLSFRPLDLIKVFDPWIKKSFRLFGLVGGWLNSLIYGLEMIKEIDLTVKNLCNNHKI